MDSLDRASCVDEDPRYLDTPTREAVSSSTKFDQSTTPQAADVCAGD